eukprot:TRINITY_DN10680_c0_g1_i1.p1 TRINITY_DN10680_c0_g1~~TRINITY_DN10680_c0_g1_i1.p1  ORF type:complete len:259 (-),score=21.85 TRINITY_DN10680_c0_g1_i1:4-780(-)
MANRWTWILLWSFSLSLAQSAEQCDEASLLTVSRQDRENGDETRTPVTMATGTPLCHCDHFVDQPEYGQYGECSSDQPCCQHHNFEDDTCWKQKPDQACQPGSSLCTYGGTTTVTTTSSGETTTTITTVTTTSSGETTTTSEDIKTTTTAGEVVSWHLGKLGDNCFQTCKLANTTNCNNYLMIGNRTDDEWKAIFAEQGYECTRVSRPRPPRKSGPLRPMVTTSYPGSCLVQADGEEGDSCNTYAPQIRRLCTCRTLV